MKIGRFELVDRERPLTGVQRRKDRGEGDDRPDEVDRERNHELRRAAARENRADSRGAEHDRGGECDQKTHCARILRHVLPAQRLLQRCAIDSVKQIFERLEQLGCAGGP